MVADAGGVPARRGIGRLRPVRATLDGLSQAGTWLKRFFSNPQANLAGLEPGLRKAIPFLAVLFLIILAFVRFVSLMEHRGAIETAARERLAITATICLLYTSPSPRDKRQSRMPSSA